MPRPAVTPAQALLPLRAFLGGTFVYAGVQKLSDPGYLHPGAPTYIGTQLHGFAQGTPGGFLLTTFALPHAQLAGVGVALLEIAIGVLVVAGLLTRAAAAAGLALNLVLFLTASWKTSPYFLGPDIVFVFAWLPFVLAGADGQPSVASVLDARAPQPHVPPGEAGMTRRRLLEQGLMAAGAATLGLAGFATLAKGSYTRPLRKLGAGAPAAAPRHAPPKQAARPAAPELPPGAVKLGPAGRLPRGEAAVYKDPADGSDDLLIRGKNG